MRDAPISRCAGWSFEEWWQYERRANNKTEDGARAQELRVCEFVGRFRAWVQRKLEYDDESFDSLRDDFVGLMDENPAIRDTFFASAGATRDKVPMTLFNLCQITEAISGHRAGFDENLTWLGRSGNNGKGTIRAHLDYL